MSITPKIIDYSIYDEEGEFLDVLSMTEKEMKKYKKEFPLYLIEELEDEKIDNDE